MNNLLKFQAPVKEALQGGIPDHLSLDSFEEAIEFFMLHSQAKNLSAETIHWYRNRLAYFAEFLRENMTSLPPSTITSNDIKLFIVSLQNRKHKIRKEQNLSSYTIKGIVRTLKIFFKCLYNENFLDHDPSARVQIPKVTKKIIKPFSQEHIKTLFSVIDTKTFSGLRNYLMFLIFLDTGVRVSELLNLKQKDINFSDFTFCVHGKGAKERSVPFGKKVAQSLVKFLKWRRKINPDDYVFVDKAGKKLSRRRVEEIVKDYGNKAKIEGVRTSPHTFRHTFALNWINADGDALSLQKILGHSSLEMVRNYVNSSSADIVLKHRKYGLVDKLELPKYRGTNKDVNHPQI